MFQHNPVPIFTKQENDLLNIHCNPDPYVIHYQGAYYCYSSGYYGINVLRSDNLETFEHMGFALSEVNWVSYWAPCVIYSKGLFYLYYSSIPKGESDDHRHYLQAAVSESPLGPFTYKKTLYEEFSIDPHVVEKNGNFYLFYSSNDWDGSMTGKTGTTIFMDCLDDLLTPQKKPRLVMAPSIEQEIFSKNRFGDGKDWYTLEGAFYHEQNGLGYLFYSGNSYTNQDYFVGYALCDPALPLEEAIFQKYPDPQTYFPLLGKDTFFSGCGHNSIIQGPDGEFYIIYHGRPRTENITPTRLDDGRRLCISRLLSDGKKLAIAERWGTVS